MTNDDYFTLEMAEKNLEQIKPHLERARALKHEVEVICAKYDYDSGMLLCEKETLQPKLDALSLEIDHIESLGAYIKDLDIGLLDFLSTFQGQDIFLCWKRGEERIHHWHYTNEGFASRQEILDLTEEDIEPEERDIIKAMRLRIKRPKQGDKIE